MRAEGDLELKVVEVRTKHQETAADRPIDQDVIERWRLGMKDSKIQVCHVERKEQSIRKFGRKVDRIRRLW